MKNISKTFANAAMGIVVFAASLSMAACNSNEEAPSEELNDAWTYMTPRLEEKDFKPRVYEDETQRKEDAYDYFRSGRREEAIAIDSSFRWKTYDTFGNLQDMSDKQRLDKYGNECRNFLRGMLDEAEGDSDYGLQPNIKTLTREFNKAHSTDRYTVTAKIISKGAGPDTELSGRVFVKDENTGMGKTF